MRPPRMGSGQWSSVSALPVAVQRRILLGRHIATELPVIPGRRLGTGVAAFGGLGLLGPVGLAVFRLAVIAESPVVNWRGHRRLHSVPGRALYQPEGQAALRRAGADEAA